MDSSEDVYLNLMKYCNTIYTAKNSQEIKKADEFLTNFIQIQNLETLNKVLFYSNNDYLQFYSSKALNILVTRNFITIPTNFKIQMLNDIQSFLVS